MKALFRCEKNWQKINVQRFSANFLFSKNGKCRSITYSGDFATLPFMNIISDISSGLQLCRYSPTEALHRCGQSVRKLRSVCRSDGADQAS